MGLKWLENMEQRFYKFQNLRLQIEDKGLFGHSFGLKSLQTPSALETPMGLTQSERKLSAPVSGNAVEISTRLFAAVIFCLSVVGCANGANTPSTAISNQPQSQSAQVLRELFGNSPGPFAPEGDPASDANGDSKDEPAEKFSAAAKRVRQVTDWLKFVRQEKTIAILESTLGPGLNFDSLPAATSATTSFASGASEPEAEFAMWRRLLGYGADENRPTRDLDRVSLDTLAYLLSAAASPEELQGSDKLLVESAAVARY